MFNPFKKPEVSPFIVGPVEQRDLVRLQSVFEASGQGLPIVTPSLPPGVIELEGVPADSNKALVELFSHVSKAMRLAARHNRFVRDHLLVLASSSLKVNGLAGRVQPRENKHYINVTAGTVLKSFVVTLRSVGVKISRAEKPLREARSMFFPGDVFSIPSDEEDLIYAQTSAYYGALTVWLHELAHVVRGHTSYLEKATGMDAIAEAGGSKVSGDMLVIRRLMEVDADCFAGQFLAQTLFDDAIREPSLAGSQCFKQRFEQVATGILAIYMGFGPRNRIYFSGPCRALFILSTILNHLGVAQKLGGWLGALVDSVQLDMAQANVMDIKDATIFAEEIQELSGKVIPQLARQEHLWLECAPWNPERDTISRTGWRWPWQ